VRFEQLLSNLSSDAYHNTDYQIRYENAQKVYELAKKLFEKDRLRESRELIRLGINMMTSSNLK
jgi:hypothetical protein